VQNLIPLATAVIIHTAKEAEKPEQGRDAKECVDTPFFADLLKVVGFEQREVTSVINKIKTGNYNRRKLHQAYRSDTLKVQAPAVEG
jgi:hypothetical protein